MVIKGRVKDGRWIRAKRVTGLPRRAYGLSAEYPRKFARRKLMVVFLLR